MSEGDRSFSSVAKDKVLTGQASIKNCAVTEVNSAVIDLAAFNVKAAITSTMQQVKNTEQALHIAETSTQGLTGCLRKARHSLKGAWADTEMVSFANTGLKTCCHCNCRCRSHGSALCPPHSQNASPEGRDWCSRLTMDFRITSSSLFRGDLGKGVAEAATGSRSYKSLGDGLILFRSGHT